MIKTHKHVILITSVGSISAKHIIEQLYGQNDLIVIDTNPIDYLPIDERQIKKFYKSPPVINTEEYLKFIITIIKINNISIIIPLTDVDVDFFSNKRKLFDNIVLAIPNQSAVANLRDKYKFYNKLKNKGISLIPTFEINKVFINDLTFPAVVKPKNGRSSIDTFTINRYTDLNYSQISLNHIVQPYINGKLIVVDLLVEKSRDYSYCAREELIRTKNGVGVTVKYIPANSRLDKIISTIITVLKIHGLINIEFIWNEVDYFLMDINPRPSAGIIFSYRFGFNFISKIIDVHIYDNIETNFSYNGVKIIKRVYNELI